MSERNRTERKGTVFFQPQFRCKKEMPIGIIMKRINSKTKKVVLALKKSGKKTDPQGSYTGRPENKNEKPIQDADDL